MIIKLLYLIPFLHQTTTWCRWCCWCRWLYLIPFLHQTTTNAFTFSIKRCCILFHFYIKPQLRRHNRTRFQVVSYSISTSNHNPPGCTLFSIKVVSYSISTSNHNHSAANSNCHGLYLIPFLHQTTTSTILLLSLIMLYLIPFLHQTTTVWTENFSTALLYLIPFLHQTTTWLKSI